MLLQVKTSKDGQNWASSFATEVNETKETYELLGRTADRAGEFPLEDKILNKNKFYVRIYRSA